MPEDIINQKDFEQKVKKNKIDQLLIFYGDNSDCRLLNRYSIVALSVAQELQKQIKVYRINLDHVQLSSEDEEEYQSGNRVICCTTINEGVVMEKQVNPFETTLRQMVRNILV
jgi:hypothetical protein